MTILRGEMLIAGAVRGIALVTDTPLSFWGGLDPDSGEVIDRRHPWSGQSVANRILALPHGRGSCSASGVLLEAVANGVGPAAIVVSRVDPIVGLGAILAEELLERTVPVVLLADADRRAIHDGDEVSIASDGAVRIVRESEFPHPQPLSHRDGRGALGAAVGGEGIPSSG